MEHGSRPRAVAAALAEAVQFVWRPNAVEDTQPLCWRTEKEMHTRLTSDTNMVWRIHRVRQWAREPAAALVPDARADSHSSVPRIVPGSPWRRNHVVLDAAGSTIMDQSSTSHPPTIGGHGLRRERVGHGRWRRLEFLLPGRVPCPTLPHRRPTLHFDRLRQPSDMDRFGTTRTVAGANLDYSRRREVSAA